ncbi:MAG: cyclic nucleotide-binding domain-containing protein [Bacteroidota bacterium]
MNIEATIRRLSLGSDEEITVILDSLKKRVLPKEAFLVRAGQVCDEYFFIEKGSLRLYYEKEEMDYTVWIGTEGEVFTNLESYLDGSNSRIYIQALEASVVFSIQKSESDVLAKRSNPYNTLLRKTVEIAFVNLSKNVISFQSDEAEERYQRVLKEKNWLAKYPLKYISSFIGVTQSTLSRIRARKR